MKPITEKQIEEYALNELQALAYSYLLGSVISPGGEQPERESYDHVLPLGRLRDAVARINLGIPTRQARRQFKRLQSSTAPTFRPTTKN